MDKHRHPRGMRWWEDVLRGNRKGWLPDSVRKIARLGSVGYQWGVEGRERLYREGWIKPKRLPRKTICVGNITVGGTGKTPLVIRLASDLLAAGLKPAILLRGYKREKNFSNPIVVRDTHGIRARVEESGDEAMEIAERLPGSVVGVGANRFQVGSFLLKRYPIDCFLLDDGFQHYQLERDFNLITIDVTDPWGGGWLLPAGFLRESPQALRRANAVVLTRTGLVGPDRLKVLKAEVTGFTRKGTSILSSRHEPDSLIHLMDEEPVALSELKKRPVMALSGIGRPDAFEATLQRLGAVIQSSTQFPDHGGNPEDVREWINRSRRPQSWIVMTEKDAMRWKSCSRTTRFWQNVYVLRMKLSFSSASAWDSLVQQIVHAPFQR